MLGRVLLLLAVSSAAWAEPPAHQMYVPEQPELVGPPNWVLTPSGYQNLQADMTKRWLELEALKAENAKLREDVTTMSQKRELTWRGALLFVGIGVVVGTAGAVGGKALADHFARR